MCVGGGWSREEVFHGLYQLFASFPMLLLSRSSARRSGCGLEFTEAWKSCGLS